MGLTPWITKNVIDRITITGYRRLSYHNHRVTGDDDAFKFGTYGGQGDKQFTDFGRVNFSGRKVFGALNFDLALEDSRFRDPQGQRVTLDYTVGQWGIKAGDIRGQLLNTNRFARFNKSLRGAMLDYVGGPLKARVMASDVKGVAKTISIQGTNTAGPYYLQSSQIVRGSETIEVDGVRQRLGEDYTIDYEIGSISFVNSRTLEAKIIPPTSVIVATYEVFGFSGSTGQLQGIGVSYQFGDYGTLGLTGMRQITGATGQLSTRLEKFQGFGPPSTPYFLQFEPLQTHPIVIRVDGVIQVEGVDYVFDAENPSIFFFTRFMAAERNIDVLYTPKPTSTVNGDRQAVGWDYRLPFGSIRDGGVLTYSEATGRLMNTPTPSSGTARSLDLRYATGPYEFIGTARNVPASYVSVETTGFSRNDKAVNYSLNYRPGPGLRYSAFHQNNNIASRQIDGDGNPFFVNSRFVRTGGSIESSGMLFGSPLRLEFGRNSTSRRNQKSQIDSVQLSSNRKFGKLDSRVTLGHLIGVSEDGGGAREQAAVNSLDLRTTYDASSANGNRVWQAALSTGLSQVSTDDESGLGRDIVGSLTYKQQKEYNTILTAALEYQDSDAGKVATLSQFTSGFGIGFNGNGFSGGAGNTGLTSTAKLQRLRFRSSYYPSERLSLNGYAYTQRSEGSFSSNSRTNGVGLDVSADFGQSLFASAGLNWSQTRFVGSPARSNTTSLNFSLDGTPPGNFSYSAILSLLLSGGNGSFGQNAVNFDAALNYRLANRHSLSFTVLSGQTSGYLPQDTLDLSLAYQYRIWQSVALQVGYRFRDIQNRDPLASSGAYKSSGFDVELVFNFGL